MNRRRHVLFAVFAGMAVLSAAQSVSFGQAVEVKGRIDAVTVYRGQALVTRVVDVPGGVGLKEIIVSGLPDQIEAASLYAESSAGVEVRSVSYGVRPVEKDVREEVQKLDEQIRSNQDKLNANQRKRESLNAQRDYLTKLETFTAGTSTVELSKGVLNADTLTKITQFQFAERARIVDETLKLELEARALTEQLQTLQRQRSQVATSSSKLAREARVFANVTAPNGQVRLRYIVNNATWLPSYNVRVDAAREKVTVEYLASIQQMSGEDWTNVQMTLSTATPSLVAKAPVLNELAISLARPGQAPTDLLAQQEQAEQARFDLRQQQQAVEAFRGTIGSNSNFGFNQLANTTANPINGFIINGEGNRINIAGTVVNLDYIGDNNDVDLVLNKTAADLQLVDLLARERIARSKDPKALTRNEEGLAVTYKLSNSTSLLSRSDRQLIQISSIPLNAKFYKVASPVLSNFVYDEAEVTNDSQMVFLFGDVSTYVDNQFVGRGVMPSVAIGQSFTVGLGIDSSLRASRSLVEKTENTQGGNRVVDFTYHLSLQNFGSKAASVRLLDRLPTAKEEQVRVSLLPPGRDGKELSKDPAYEQNDRKRNILRWDLEVPAQAIDSKAVVVEYQFRLEYDRTMTIAAPAAPAATSGGAGGAGGRGGAGGGGGRGRGAAQ